MICSNVGKYITKDQQRMNLITTCENCKQELRIWTFAQDRVELARQKGDQIALTCKKCSSTSKYPVDDFSAVPNRFLQSIALLTFLMGTPLIIWLIWDVIWNLTMSYLILVASGLFLIPVIIYGLILKNDRLRVNSFNRHRFKGHQAFTKKSR